MDNSIEVAELINELAIIKEMGTLDTKEKREHQVRVFLANCGSESDPYKPLMSSIVQTSMGLQSFLVEHNLDLTTIINNDSSIDEKSKKMLISYTKDLEYLKPFGGNVPLLPGLEFTPETIEAIKTWGIIITTFCTLANFIPSMRSKLLDIKLKSQQILINKQIINEKKNKRSK